MTLTFLFGYWQLALVMLGSLPLMIAAMGVQIILMVGLQVNILGPLRSITCMTVSYGAPFMAHYDGMVS